MVLFSNVHAAMVKAPLRNPSSAVIHRPGSDDDDIQSRLARNLLNPVSSGALAVSQLGRWIDNDIDVIALKDELSLQCRSVSAGDMTRPESMLLTQAHTLDALFGTLCMTALLNQDRADVFDRVMRLAFKAQSQCRCTLETLSTIKHPPLVLAHQANISNGPQQVNIGPMPSRELENRQNKLLEAQNDYGLDVGAAAATGCIDTAMAPLGKVHRP